MLTSLVVSPLIVTSTYPRWGMEVKDLPRGAPAAIPRATFPSAAPATMAAGRFPGA
jgi:hypothetical protein